MTRVVDRGAIVAAYVGIGMAVTIGISFLLVIPIEPIYWLLSIPAGLLIGYYANQRSDRRRPVGPHHCQRAVFAGGVTGSRLALLLLVREGAVLLTPTTAIATEPQGGSLSTARRVRTARMRATSTTGEARLAAAGIDRRRRRSTAFYWSPAGSDGWSSSSCCPWDGASSAASLYGGARGRR